MSTEKPAETPATEAPSDKKPAKKGAAKDPAKKKLSKALVLESDLAGGVAVQDYSHLYKSFYDIFVGGILEPKTFDLQFVVRDTRNTYAQFVSLMSIDKKKY